jgi:plastocyanin
MKASLWIIIIVVVLLAGGVYFLTQSGYKTPAINQNANPTPNTNPSTNNPSTNPSSGTPQTHVVEISGFAFNPTTLTIKVGDTVTWTNKDSTSHTVTSDSGSGLASSTFGNGKTYSHTFNTAGTFAYHCSIHTSMKATIVVE